MKRAALIVGVNRYEDEAIANLDFAENDAIELWSFLKHEARYDDARKLLAVDDDSILDTAEDMVRDLGPGDLFLFYFAGHAIEHASQHLLLCPKVRQRRLVDPSGKLYTNHTVAVDLLRDQTARPGLARVFVLDACRRNLRQGRDGAVDGLKNSGSLRDLVAAPAVERAEEEAASMAILCSCDEGGQAQELRPVQHGLFSHALLGLMGAALRERRSLRANSDLEGQLRERMRLLAAQHGLPRDQRPWIKHSGEVPVLVGSEPDPAGGEVLSPVSIQLSPPASAARVLCPLCGLRNVADETFRCLKCGRDFLCRDHLVKKERCCEECAEKLAKAGAEAQRPANGEAARQEALRRPAEEEKQGTAASGRQPEEAGCRQPAPAEAAARPAFPAQPRITWANSLGMEFLPMPGTAVWLCIWQTRVQDYEAFVKATGRAWPKAGFEQGPTHPAVNVSWEDARAFCLWLQELERAGGRLGRDRSYRLPTDAEWSLAAGLPAERGRTPCEKNRRIQGAYPWGSQWPPPVGAGNYRPSLGGDSHDYTAPVGSFQANALGLHDLGGNVWEWCEDWYRSNREHRVLRGASWREDNPYDLLSSCRFEAAPEDRDDNIGFRVALVGSLPCPVCVPPLLSAMPKAE